MSRSPAPLDFSSPSQPGVPPAADARARPLALYVMDPASRDLVYGPAEQALLAEKAEIIGPLLNARSALAHPELLERVEVIFSGWGAPVMDAAFLAVAPHLRAVFYGAGSVRGFVTEAFWDRDILLTSAYAANAVPVAEFALGVILLSLKRFWSYSREVRSDRGWGDHTRPMTGAYRSTVGLVSVGMIGRRTISHLRSFDVNIAVYCPFLTEAEATRLGVERCSLAELFRCCDVISLHTPDLPETRGLITGELIASMKPFSTLINTARGAIVQEQDLLDVLRERDDLTAVLDVCHPEPPAPGADITRLPNVVLTPHIAGSMGPECLRLGKYMADEFERYLAGQPLQWKLKREVAATMA